MTRPRDIGTAVESAIRKVCREYGFPHAERNPLYGSRDQGDLVLTPGIIIEAKGGKQAENASDGRIAEWMDELDHAVGNSNAQIGFLVTKRKGIGHDNAHRWWAHIRLSDIPRTDGDYATIIRLHLGDFLDYLKRDDW